MTSSRFGYDATVIDRVITEAQPAIAARCELAREQAKSVKQGTRSDLTSLLNNDVRQGTSAEYLLRRLARDHPDVLEQYEAGQFPSVRQAAIAEAAAKGPLAKPGEIGNGRSRGVINTSTQRGSTNREYLVRRLMRDAPEVYRQLQAGDFPSVRQQWTNGPTCNLRTRG